ncbi:substrate-binding periplasmic protein [Psychromonas aquimarina]|uniref:substrate-binding periplasmic protein n=1 Tax=Psychromonas aquimarina TaxID=444919 RepID=UPI000422F07F|nr:ABC transporter substrate-binding protein [Psychromonas aquimarina]
MSAVKTILCFFIPLLISSASFSKEVDQLYLMTENYPPYNFEENGQLKGISIDLMALILEKLDSTQSRSDIALLPWARAYQYLLTKSNTCLFSMMRLEERENLFKWVGPIIPINIGLIARKDSHIMINSIGDLKNYRLSTTRSDASELLLVKAGIELKSLDRAAGGIDANLLSIKKLIWGRSDAWVYDEVSAGWILENNGYAPDEYEMKYGLSTGELYFAFHINTSDDLIAEMQNVLDMLKRDGSYQQIVDNYIKDSEPYVGRDY